MTGSRFFASIGLFLTIGGIIGTAVVRFVAPAPFLETVFGFDGVVMVGYLIEGLSWAAVGALLVIRRPGNAVGWLMIPVGAGYALSMLASALTFALVADGSATGARLAQYAGWATVLFQLVGMLLLGIGFVFPTGRLQSRRWAWFMWLYVVFGGAFVVLSLTQPGPLQLIPDLENPFGVGPDLRGDRPFAPFLAGFAPVLIGGLVISMATRYRNADRVERQQLKWFALALSASAIGLAVVTIEAVILDRPTDAIGLTINVFGGTLVPVAIGIAILRHHLYDIDRIVSRTIGYAIVTAALAGVFALAALVLGALLGAQGAGETFQVAGATLLVFALFGRVRRRVQTAVDRRFDRAHYDAERTAAAFAARLGGDLDLGTVRSEIIQTASAAVRPTTAAVWLRGTSR
jgi:hypothetical protein